MHYTIGVLFDSLYDEYENTIWQQIIKIAQQQDLNLISFAVGAINSPYEQNTKRNILYKLITPDKIDGIIAFSASIGSYSNPGKVRALFKYFSDVPVVSIGVPLDSASAVLVDNMAGMSQIMDHLINYHNYRRIAFIKGPDGNVEAEQRFHVYLQSLKKNGIRVDENLIVQGDFCRLSGSKAIRPLLKRRKRDFEAIVCANDYMALDAMMEMEKRGIHVPKHVAVTGFDDIFESRCTLYPITTVRQPAFEIARNAIESILGMIEGKARNSIVLPAKAVFRRSCGCFMFVSDNQKLLKEADLKIRIMEEMDYNFPESIEPGMKSRWADQLIQTLQESISGNNDRLLYVLEGILIETFELYFNPLSWYPVISCLFSQAEPFMAETARAGNDHGDQQNPIPGESVRADNEQKEKSFFHRIWKDALVVTGNMAEHAQANIRLMKKIQGYNLHLIEEAFRNLFDFEKQKKLLTMHLPVVKIHNFYLGLYPDSKDTDHVIIAAAFQNDQCQVPDNEKISIHSFLGYCIKPEKPPGTYVVFPIHSDNEQLGIAIIQVGENRGSIYEVLATQLNSSVHEAAMFNKQKKYAHDLEIQVRERTRELEQINKELEKTNRELGASNENILCLNRELEFKNKLDGLTKLYNRTAIYDFLENGFGSIEKNYWRTEPGTPLNRRGSDNNAITANRGMPVGKLSGFSLIMIDIDHFKQINDTYGHIFGDRVLIMLSQLFQEPQLLRSIDIIGRFGGEEFLIVLPFTEPADAMQVAERIRQKLAEMEIVYNESTIIRITLSMGISRYYKDDENIESVISRADMALYYAKAHGRDLIVNFSDAFKK